ncbi:MAG: DUF1043 family protein [Wenzhouxiangellaceae bacterium]
MEFVIWLIVGLVIGGGIGALATWWISRARGGAVSVMQLKQENDKFRNEVTEHFVETARLINQMTDSYKQVFDHLSSGAEKLVDDHKLAERLPPSSGQEVKLSNFGAPGSAGSGAASSGRESARVGAGGGDSGRKQQSSGSDTPAKSASTDPLKNRSDRVGVESGAQSGQPGQRSGATGQAGNRTSPAGSTGTGTPDRKDSTSTQASEKSRSSD